MITINAKRLAIMVIESGMGQVELCLKAEVGHQTLAKMLRGKMVRFAAVARICRILEIPPAEIIKEVPDEIIPAQKQQELVSSAGQHTDKSEDSAQGPRLAVVGRIPG
jgi:DNA-binding Xre family transcriptional regulator